MTQRSMPEALQRPTRDHYILPSLPVARLGYRRVTVGTECEKRVEPTHSTGTAGRNRSLTTNRGGGGAGWVVGGRGLR